MHNKIIDNLRGLSMLGVLGIHVGFATIDSNNSFMLFFIIDILTRYSIPTFFFISGYGLFCHPKTGTYLEFLKKRLRSVGIPYIVWSFFYLAYATQVLPAGSIDWHPCQIALKLFFGLGGYHLYFIVILIWFYTLQPLWYKLVNIINKNLIIGMVSLFIFQLAFYFLHANTEFDTQSWTYLAQKFYAYRLNYLPLYYLFIFIFGAILALHWNNFLVYLRKHTAIVLLAHLSTTVYLLYCNWTSYIVENYTFEELAYTYHQLSYQGFLYTITSISVFCLFCDFLERKAVTSKLSNIMLKVISTLSSHSALIYFLHPFVLYLLTEPIYKHSFVFNTKPKIILLYFITLSISLLTSILLTKILQKSKLLRLFLTGK